MRNPPTEIESKAFGFDWLLADKRMAEAGSLVVWPFSSSMFKQSLVCLSKPSRTLATHAATAVRPRPEESAFVPQRWERNQVREIFDGPLLDLVFRSASVHRQHHDPSKIQLCTLMNIKSGFRIQAPFRATGSFIHFSRRMF